MSLGKTNVFAVLSLVVVGALLTSGQSLQPPRVTDLPQYEAHSFPVPEPQRTITITNEVTKTHTLRVPSTSDVWVTEVKVIPVTVTVQSTIHSYQPQTANTVTSFVRVTNTKMSMETREAEIYPVKTLVSVFTRFVTETSTVELWQPIVHMATSYDIMTVPVVESQTLLQRLFTTTTITDVVDITSTVRRW